MRRKKVKIKDITIVIAIFASKIKCCTCNLFLAFESHIGKTPSLFLPYKAWANKKEYH